MLNRIFNIFFYIFKFADSLIYFFFKKKFLIYFKEIIEKETYKILNISDKKIIFFTPNTTCNWRVDTFYEKEPETLEWIDNFKNGKIIFWDIGANIGLYSIYAAMKHSECEIVSFEPSTNNLRVLSRNISINKLNKKIKILTNPLTNYSNKFLDMNESTFDEGTALNTFGENFDFEGKPFYHKMSYKLLSTSINYLLENKILEIPDYIKIDVDGIEHLILEGASNFLNDKKIKSIQVEINENFKDQLNRTLLIMNENNFQFSQKKQNINNSIKFANSYNYVFNKV